MLHFHVAVIRPVLEHACSDWHSSITNEQCTRLESLQRRAVNIFNGPTKDYTEFCIKNNLPSLYKRRCDLSKRFFINNVLLSASCLHYSFPDHRDNDVNAKLRIASVCSLPLMQTERFKHSFTSYSVEHLK